MEALAQRFAEKNAALASAVEALASDQQALDAEWHALSDKPSPLQRERHENEVLQSDLAKFAKYHHEVLVPKLDKSRRTIQRLQAALVEYTTELTAKQAERTRRQQLVDAQDISSDEFERMLAERERLARQLDELTTQNREAVEQCWSLEMALTKQQTEVEKRLTHFHTGARRVDLFPLSLPNGVELTELDLVPANPSTMLAPGVSMQAVRSKIEHLRAMEAERFRTLSDERLALQESLDEALETLHRLRRDGRSAELRLEALRAQMDEVNQRGSEEEDASQAEYLRQEGIVRSIEHSSSMALQQAEARWQGLQLQLQEALESTAAERAAMHDEVCSALHSLLDIKVRVSEGLDRIAAAVSGTCRS
ncbi:Ndc80 complex protein [Malassezia pachydermatis]